MCGPRAIFTFTWAKGIDRMPSFHQLAHLGVLVRADEERALVIARHAFDQRFQIALQPDDMGVLKQEFARRRMDERPAARGQHERVVRFQ